MGGAMQHHDLPQHVEAIAHAVIGAAVAVRRALRAGLQEKLYEGAPVLSMRPRGTFAEGSHRYFSRLAIVAASAIGTVLGGCINNPIQPRVHVNMRDSEVASAIEKTFEPGMSEERAVSNARALDLVPTRVRWTKADDGSEYAAPDPSVLISKSEAPQPFVADADRAFLVGDAVPEYRRDYRVTQCNPPLFSALLISNVADERVVSLFFDDQRRLMTHAMWPDRLRAGRKRDAHSGTNDQSTTRKPQVVPPSETHASHHQSNPSAID